jgi:hypothetical protein
MSTKLSLTTPEQALYAELLLVSKLVYTAWIFLCPQVPVMSTGYAISIKTCLSCKLL